MVEKLPFVLVKRDGESIVGDVRISEGAKHRPTVVIFHSFMAFKDWGWFPLVAEKIAEAGFASVIFNFSRCGVRANPNRITDFTTFQSNTISHELDDAKIVLDAIAEGEIGSGRIDTSRLKLLGHSRGGGIAIITASRLQDVKVLVTWSSVATFDRWTPHQKEQWRKLGFLPLSRDTATSPFRLGLDLLDDVDSNREALDIVKAAGSLRIPWLLLHGREDMLVKFSEAERLFAIANREITKFLPLEHVGHTYGGAEISDDSPIHNVLSHTVDWLKGVL